jgi:hypothetical protein
MDTTIKNILNLFEQFKALNGYNKVVNVNGQDSVVVTPYQFDSKTVWNISRNLNILRKHITNYEASTDMAMLQIGIDKKTGTSDAEKIKEFNKVNADFLAEVVTLDKLFMIKYTGLNVDKNPIPSGVIAELSDFIEE